MTGFAYPRDTLDTPSYRQVSCDDRDFEDGFGRERSSTMETIALVSDEEEDLATLDNKCRNIRAEGSGVTCYQDLFDRTSAPAKVFYFVKSAGGAFLVPYLPVFYRQLGLSPAQNGVLGSLPPFITLLSAPIWGAVADRTGRLKSVLLLSLLAFNLFHLLRWFVPSAVPPGFCLPEEVSACAASGNSFSHLCHSDDLMLNKSVSNLTIASGNQSTAVLQCGHAVIETGKQMRAFAWLVALVVCTQLFSGALFGLSDAAVMHSLGKRATHLYSRQRLWGAVGWGVGTFLSGSWANAFQDSCGNGNYAIHFMGFTLLFCLACGVVAVMNLGSETKANETGIGVTYTVLQVVRQPRAMAFFFAVFVLAVARGIVKNFVFWFLKEHCASEVLLGLALLAMASSEVPVFAKADEIIAKLGYVWTIYSVFFCFTLRLLLYSVLSNPWAVLPVELFHGVTFALLWSCSVQYCNHISPPGLKATFQAILNAVANGVGEGTGSVAGGLVYQRFGAQFTFSVTSLWCLIGGMTFALSHFVIDRRDDRRRSLASENLFVQCPINSDSSGEEEVFSQFPLQKI